MVKTLLVGLLAATICGFVYAAPKLPQHHHREQNISVAIPDTAGPALEDPATRSERSTNLSHIGTARKIQMFIKNRHLQILPDGTVNGTTDDNSAYTILQRTTVGIGQMKIQGVATCQYLCMASCGLLYGSREFIDDCVFNETIEQSNYNTYSSTKYSNDKRTFYLALNRRGQPRKVMVRVHHQLGKLSSYTRVLTRNVAVEMQLPAVRHHNHVCANVAPHQTAKAHPPHQRCPKRKKKKKKKRKCSGDENDPELCQKRQNNSRSKAQNRNNNNKCIDGKYSDTCQRENNNNKKKQKLTNSDKSFVGDTKKKKKINKKTLKRKLATTELDTTTTTLPPTSTTFPDELVPDEDYGIDSFTHTDWEDSTASPDIFMAVSEATHAVPHSDSD